MLQPEWASQSGVLLTWPHAHSDWASKLATLDATYVALTGAITTSEPAIVLCHDEPHRAHVANLLANAAIPERYRLFIVPTNDTWIRDYGPLSVNRGGQSELRHFVFNGWGGKYAAELDNAACTRLAELGVFRVPLQDVDFILEGGSIDTDGAGTLITSRQCLLHPGRHAGADKGLIEQRLKHELGVRRVVWFTHTRLAGDDTDGHIDMLVRFCGPRSLVLTTCEDTDDANYAELAALREEVEAVFPPGEYQYAYLPMPRPVFDDDGRQLPASYANFLILNEAVIVPQYGDPADATARRRLKALFASRNILGVDARALITQSGSIHCATMQLSRGVL
ncbi:MAG TPA: agmatine deiminase family protein [Gammaproteobacteria bacterium]|nr:agmatine deiminase family protein [Gammaproteobacteria bacterium]